MKTTVVMASALLGALLLGGCASEPEGNTYQQVQPRLDLETFFTGEVKAWGIAQNRAGDVVQRFKVDIDGAMEDGTDRKALCRERV